MAGYLEEVGVSVQARKVLVVAPIGVRYDKGYSSYPGS